MLAGDVGGTKTSLAMYAVETGAGAAPGLRLLREESFASRAFAEFREVLDAFAIGDRPLAAASFGIAGPVEAGVVQVTNLPWRIEAASLVQRLGCPVQLLNDLEATAYATLALRDDDVVVLNPGVERMGNRCVIAAGTGLGQAVLAWDGDEYRPFSTEGGHADFAPRNDDEIELLRFLRGRYSRVSWERVLSGPGLRDLYDFVVERMGIAPDRTVAERLLRDDPSRVIGEAALADDCPASRKALDLFVEAYGAQAGNLALTTMAVGGVFIAGGIAGKILPRLQTGAFLAAFTDKEPFASLMQRIPVRVLTDPQAPRHGAAAVAATLATRA